MEFNCGLKIMYNKSNLKFYDSTDIYFYFRFVNSYFCLL